jgi:hypothetical protein
MQPGLHPRALHRRVEAGFGGCQVCERVHGYVMMGLHGSKIQLYDAAKAKTLLISPADFRHDFQAILFRK